MFLAANRLRVRERAALANLQLDVVEPGLDDVNIIGMRLVLKVLLVVDVRHVEVAEMVVTGPDRRLVARCVTPDYALLVVMGQDGNVGRARYELRKAALDLEPELR